MPYVTVILDLPCISPEARKTIYKCLQDGRWKRIKDFDKGELTVWTANFRKSTAESSAILITIKEFNKYARIFCKPCLLIQYGDHKPIKQLCIAE